MTRELLADPSRLEALKREAGALPSWELTPRQLCDLELLLNGGFAPLAGFLRRTDYERVLREMRLADGTLWPIPVILDVTEDFGAALAPGARIALRQPDGAILALLQVAELWRPDRAAEARQVYGTEDPAHPGVDALRNRTNPVYAGGELTGIELPQHYDFVRLRRTPRELREQFRKSGWRRVAALQQRGPLHRAEAESCLRAMRAADAKLLIHPAVGLELPSDPGHYARVRGYEEALAHYPEGTAALSLLPLAPRGAGPREALWHAIVQRNYGCSHFIVGPRDALQLAVQHEKELGIAIVPVEGPVYGEERVHVPRSRQGVTVFFTGLSGAGKSSIAKALMSRLLEAGGRSVTLLDGDLVRKNLSSELGFSRAHRDLNIRRIGYVAGEITRHGGIAICAPIAPYAATRAAVRRAISAEGGFLLVYVATPLEVCEARDRKGMYARARAGLLKEFTGISDPYEAPTDADLVIDTRECTPLQAAETVLARLEAEGYLRRSGSAR